MGRKLTCDNGDFANVYTKLQTMPLCPLILVQYNMD